MICKTRASTLDAKMTKHAGGGEIMLDLGDGCLGCMRICSEGVKQMEEMKQSLVAVTRLKGKDECTYDTGVLLQSCGIVGFS